jgi:DNA polymerase-1
MFGFDLSVPAGKFVETEVKARQYITKFLSSHKKNGGLGLDSETTGIVTHRDLVVIWSLSDGEDRICLPSKFIPLFKEPILENPEINFDLSNAKFDAHMFANSGADISKAGQWRDTVVMSWLRNENNQGRHGLKDCITDYFKRVTPTFESVFGKLPPKKTDKKTGKVIVQKTYADLIREALADPERRLKAADYASLDAYNATMLRKFFDVELASIELYPGMTIKDYYYLVEVPFTKVLWNLERRGISVDRGYLLNLEGPMISKMQEIEKEFNREAGKMLNLNSPVDVRWFFYDHLDKAVEKLTKGGNSGNKQPSTDNSVLEQWAGEGDLWAQKLVQHREIAKIFGTYVMGLQEWVDRYCKIHTRLNQTGTVTGRLSSSDPNLQNIPSIIYDIFKIREAFVPSEGMVLIVADYAQLEMRLMAHFSGDEKMINAIKNGIDLHCLTVSEMEGIPYDEIKSAVDTEKAKKKAESSGQVHRELIDREKDLLVKRQNAKATGFGILYGIGGPKLANGLTAELARTTKPGDAKPFISEEEGWSLIKKWLAVFPGVKQYIGSIKDRIWRYGQVQTLLGRLRRFGDLKGMSKRDSAQCERQGVNSIIQGTAADIAKMAMITAEYDPYLNQLGARLLLQVHDELIWECPDNSETIKAVKKRVKEIMEHPFQTELLVPLPCEVGHGYTWASAK